MVEFKIKRIEENVINPASGKAQMKKVFNGAKEAIQFQGLKSQKRIEEDRFRKFKD